MMEYLVLALLLALTVATTVTFIVGQRLFFRRLSEGEYSERTDSKLLIWFVAYTAPPGVALLYLLALWWLALPYSAELTLGLLVFPGVVFFILAGVAAFYWRTPREAPVSDHSLEPSE